MTTPILFASLLIFLARLIDVSLDTLRMIAVFRGHRMWAWLFGFVQVIVWIYAVSYAMQHIHDHPIVAVSYALGFACGNFLGVTIERWLAHGEQVIRVFTNPEHAEPIACRLRGHGYGVTIFEGRGKDGPVSQLFVESSRKRVNDVAKLCRAMDPGCFYIIGDIRVASTASFKGKAAQRPITQADLAAAHSGAASGGAAK